MSNLRFDDTVAIVTGAGRGIGRAHARMLASRNVRVVINDIDRDAAHDTVAEIESEGGSALASVTDLTTTAGVDATVEAALSGLGGLHIIVGNAGLFSQAEILALEPDVLRRHLELDAVASFQLVKAGWTHLVGQNYGRIVLTSSSAAFGTSTEIAYSIGKASIIGLARSLAVAGKEHGIRVNAITPFGYSRMTAANGNLTAAELGARESLIPPTLVSAAVTALVHESCPVTGELFVCGGGRIATIKLMQARGYTNPHLTPEDVVSRWEEVLDDSQLEPIGTSYEHATSICASLPGWSEAMANAASPAQS